MLTGVSHVVPGYDSSMSMISAQMHTGQRFVVVRHCVTVEFLTPFFCVRNVGYILSARWEDPTIVWKFMAFSVILYITFLEDACDFFLPFGISVVRKVSNAKEKMHLQSVGQ